MPKCHAWQFGTNIVIMKAYKFGDSDGFYPLLIVSDEDVRIVNVGGATVEENICHEYVNPKMGNTRLLFGGSSFPYKNADGQICDKWHEINIS